MEFRMQFNEINEISRVDEYRLVETDQANNNMRYVIFAEQAPVACTHMMGLAQWLLEIAARERWIGKPLQLEGSDKWLMPNTGIAIGEKVIALVFEERVKLL